MNDPTPTPPIRPQEPTPTPPIESARTIPLSEHGQAGQTVGLGAAQPSSIFGGPDPSAEKPGDEIGAYVLVSKLGEGGFGSVWLAERRKPFVQRVALKIIKAGMDSRSIITRFEQERQTLAVMNHPNVARVIDGGVTPAGGPYFVMEYVKGQPITDFCDARALSNRDRLSVFIQVCEAVQHAHSKGIIHRDLKPGNILVSAADGEHPLVKVIDFGVAKALTQLDTDDLAKEEEGKMVGTPEYMSPEQAEAENDQIDTRSDVYSLGVILYELISGLLPFDSSELRSKSYGEIQRTIREEAPPTLSQRLSMIAEKSRTEIKRIEHDHGARFEALLRDLKRELEWIPGKAMRKEPKNRYQTAAAMAEDIRRYLDGRALEAAPDSTAYRVRKYVVRYRGLVSAAAVALLALVAGLALALWQWREASLARNLAVASEAQAVEQRNVADAARVEATKAKDTALAAEAKAVKERQAADAARERVEAEAYIANVQMGNAWLESGQLGRVRERLDACPPARRGWEWGWLEARADGSLAQFRVPGSGEMLVARFSPDGTRALTLTFDRTVRVWDTATAALVAELKGSPAELNAAVFSPDGRRIATASADGTARVWDAASGAVVAELKGHAKPVFAVAFNDDGSRVATASGDGTARLWNAGTGASIAELKGHGDAVQVVAFSPDGKRVLTGSLDHTLRLWDAASGAPVAELKGHEGAVNAIAWSPAGSLIASGGQEGTARVWKPDGTSVAVMKGHAGPINAIAFTPDGRRLITGSADRTARAWDAESGSLRATMKGHDQGVMSVACSPDGKVALTGASDGTARVWDLPTGQALATLAGHADQVFGAGFSPDGARVLTASLDGSARLWETFPRTQVQETKGHAGVVFSVVSSPDGARFVTCSADGTARIWNAADLTRSVTLSGHGGAVTGARFSPDGSRVVTCSADKTARVWDARTGSQLLQLDGHAGPVSVARFSQDGGRIVTSSGDRTARVWDATSGRMLRELKGHADRVTGARFSADGSRVVTWSPDRTVRIWDAASGAQLQELKGHGDAVASATFTADGTRVVSASADHVARVWNAASGEMLAEMRAGDEALRGAVPSPDGRRVLVFSLRERVARLFDAGSGALVAELRGHAEPITFAEFSADGSRILTTSVDRTARLWDAPSGAPLTELKGTTEGLASGAFLLDGSRLATVSADGMVRVWDGVPERIRFAERQFAQQGRDANLGEAYLAEPHRAAAATWVTDPRATSNRPQFMRTSGDAGLDPASLGRGLRQALSDGRVQAAIEAARAWGVAALDSDLLNTLAWQGVTKLQPSDPARDLPFLLECAREAAARTNRRDPTFLDTLARVHWERGERERAVQVAQEAIAAIDAQPVPSGADAQARRATLRASIEKSLQGYQAPPDSPPAPTRP